MSIIKKIAKKIKNKAENVTGYKFMVVPRGLNTGLSFIDDVKKQGHNVNTVFDVGAHRGETTNEFLEKFNNCRVHAFEPHPQNYKILEKNCSNSVVLNKCGLSDSSGNKNLNVSKHSTAHSLSISKNRSKKTAIEVKTVDSYCDYKNVDKIDILKIDTEGHDIEVLKGAQKKLDEGEIYYVFAEVTLSLTNPYICNFVNIRDYLSKYDFDFLAIYNQNLDFSNKRKHLFANAAFVHKSAPL